MDIARYQDAPRSCNTVLRENAVACADRIAFTTGLRFLITDKVRNEFKIQVHTYKG